jgi:hypothetical protein
MKLKKHEIARFASKINTNVVGGFGKLLSYVSKIHNNIIFLTYVDIRHGQNSKQYMNNGFKLINKTAPRFWWTDTNKRYDRFSIRATKDNTEAENSVIKRKLKIWGVSNLIFEKII